MGDLTGSLFMEEEPMILQTFPLPDGTAVKSLGMPKFLQHTFHNTGLMIWPAARVMADWVVRHGDVFEGKHVIELGSGGMALCALALAKTARAVCATDGDEETIELLKQNLTLNISNGFPARGDVSCERLWWGDDADLARVKGLTENGFFDIAIGADITYSDEPLPALFQTASRLLRPGAVFYVCYMDRHSNEFEVFRQAQLNGFTLSDTVVLEGSALRLSTLQLGVRDSTG